MYRYARRFSIFFVFVALSIFGAVASAAGVDDVKAGEAAKQRGEHDEAIRLYTRALESSELSTDNQANVFNSRGLSWYSKKDYDITDKILDKLEE